MGRRINGCIKLRDYDGDMSRWADWVDEGMTEEKREGCKGGLKGGNGQGCCKASWDGWLDGCID